MIISGEIHKIAARLKLRPGQIEKDYVLGWILRGISKNGFLKDKLIFKGGTAIRKIYVKDYRLSENLDLHTRKKAWMNLKLKNNWIDERMG